MNGACVVVMAAAAAAAFEVERGDGSLRVRLEQASVATYVWEDETTPRPFWKDLHAPGNLRVTRSHPPVEGREATDHATMHPGLWLAFGDISGHDFWRNKAGVRLDRFLEEPVLGDGTLTFAVQCSLRSVDGTVLGHQQDRFVFSALPGGILLTWEATFLPAATGPLVFGDQEEMGLGIRLAPDLVERNGGRIRSSAGGEGAAATWGHPARWCDASGIVDGRRVGVTLIADPVGFRPSWWHNRDYGLMVANAFGRQAMRRGPPSAVTISASNPLTLRFAVFLHRGASETDIRAVAEAFLNRP